MTARQAIMCLLFALGLSVGQIFFKFAAGDIRARAPAGWLYAVLSPWLIAALVLYTFITALWLLLLTELPLSRAYPFSLVGSALVPVFAAMVLGETIDARYVVGFGLMLLGLVVILTNG